MLTDLEICRAAYDGFLERWSRESDRVERQRAEYGEPGKLAVAREQRAWDKLQQIQKIVFEMEKRKNA